MLHRMGRQGPVAAVPPPLRRHLLQFSGRHSEQVHKVSHTQRGYLKQAEGRPAKESAESKASLLAESTGRVAWQDRQVAVQMIQAAEEAAETHCTGALAHPGLGVSG